MRARHQATPRRKKGRAASPQLTEHPIPYDDFRTGLTFGEVRMMFWSYNEDSSTWRYKRRGTVLGKWHQIKLEMYDEYLRRVEQAKLKGERFHEEESEEKQRIANGW